MCIGYMNINYAFYDLSFSLVFISKFCVILSKHFRSNLNLRFFISRENHEKKKTLIKKIVLQYLANSNNHIMHILVILNSQGSSNKANSVSTEHRTTFSVPDKKGSKEYLQIIFHITPLKRML